MVKTAKASAGYQGPEIEDGLYKLELRKVTLIPGEGPDRWDPEKKAKDQLRLMFRIDGLEDDEGEAVFIEPLVNNSISDGSGGKYPASTYYKICWALGVDTEEGVDSDDLIGLWCQGMIVTAEEGAWPRVTQYARLPKGGAKTAAKAATRAPEGQQPSPSRPPVCDKGKHVSMYTASGDFICSVCKTELDEATGEIAGE